MSEALTFLAPALTMCVVIASIHVYLGMHILEREVIFVDLSLAQLAALGAAVLTVLDEQGHEEEPSLLLPLLFSLGGAALFAFARRRRQHISQEAVVGIVYAVASALMVLVLSGAPHGAERIKDILVGSLLLTEWSSVVHLSGIYLVLGIAQVILARRFLIMSWEPSRAEQEIRGIWAWDFLFYALFAVVITFSVRVAGVLLVFSYLIAPALITRLFSKRLWPRLFAGWAVALLGSLLGLWASWTWDFPTGATVVSALGALLVIACIIRWVLPGTPAVT